MFKIYIKRIDNRIEAKLMKCPFLTPMENAAIEYKYYTSINLIRTYINGSYQVKGDIKREYIKEYKTKLFKSRVYHMNNKETVNQIYRCINKAMDLRSDSLIQQVSLIQIKEDNDPTLPDSNEEGDLLTPFDEPNDYLSFHPKAPKYGLEIIFRTYLNGSFQVIKLDHFKYSTTIITISSPDGESVDDLDAIYDGSVVNESYIQTNDSSTIIAKINSKISHYRSQGFISAECADIQVVDMTTPISECVLDKLIFVKRYEYETHWFKSITRNKTEIDQLRKIKMKMPNLPYHLLNMNSDIRANFCCIDKKWLTLSWDEIMDIPVKVIDNGKRSAEKYLSMMNSFNTQPIIVNNNPHIDSEVAKNILECMWKSDQDDDRDDDRYHYFDDD